jgi:hypothetical protein
MKNNIPTAEEWLKHFEENAYPNTPISECMIEFAKLHVEAALKEAAEKAVMKNHNEDCHYEDEDGDFPEFLVIDIDSILNSYPLENIK